VPGTVDNIGVFTTSPATRAFSVDLSYNVQGLKGNGDGVFSFGAMIIDVDEMERNAEYRSSFSTIMNRSRFITGGDGIGNYSPATMDDHNGAAYNMIRDPRITTPLRNLNYTPSKFLPDGLPNDNKANNGWDQLPWLKRNDAGTFRFNGLFVNLNNRPVGGRRFVIIAYFGVATNAGIRYNTTDSRITFYH
jgi:hypothetical protein